MDKAECNKTRNHGLVTSLGALLGGSVLNRTDLDHFLVEGLQVVGLRPCLQHPCHPCPRPIRGQLA